MKILVMGGTGKTGKLVIEEALKKGHKISAIARDPGKLKSYDIEITKGTPYDYDTVEKAIQGCDAVITTLNVSRTKEGFWAPLAAPKDMISKAASNAIAAMEKHGIKRFVAMSTLGAGRSWKTIPGILKFIVSISNLKHAFTDHGRQEELLESSPLDFTVCRAPMLSDDVDDTEAIATPEGVKPESPKLNRIAAARFYIRIIENNEHIREFVSLSNKKK